MEKGALILEADNHPRQLHPCKRAPCVHSCSHEALPARDDRDWGDKLHTGTCRGDGDPDEQPSQHQARRSPSRDLTSGTESVQADAGASRKLKLPCRRISRNSVPPSAIENLTKRPWLPSPLPSSFDESVAYTDASSVPRAVLASPHKKVDLSMLSFASTSFQIEQDITSKHRDCNQELDPLESSAVNDVSTLPAITNPRRICRYCDREFHSGRALGGHMRVHGGLDTERTLSAVETKAERKQFIALAHRSPSPMRTPTSDHQFTKVNCMARGSSSFNTGCNGAAIVTRINFKEPSARQNNERKATTSESESLRNCGAKHDRFPQLVKEKQTEIAQGIVSGAASHADIYIPKSHSPRPAEEDLNQQDRIHDEDRDGGDDNYGDEDKFHLINSELNLKIRSNVNESSRTTPPPVQSSLMSFTSDGNADEGQGTPMQKLRPNPRPSRRRLWTDQGSASAIRKKEISTINSHSAGGQLTSSPPSLPERALPDNACSCSECGKVFWSWKALFGHMRCHPEREWRGIQRPDASSQDPEKQNRASRRLTAMSVAVVSAGQENELESDAEDQGAFDAKQAACNLSTSGREDTAGIKRRVNEADLNQGSSKDVKHEIELLSSRSLVKSKFSQTSIEDDDLTPAAWPTRKRSKRSRGSPGAAPKVSSMNSVEPALTSETATSSELKDNDKVSVRDQEDLDMANCLVLLSTAGDDVQRKAAKQQFQEPTYKRRPMSSDQHRCLQANDVSSNDTGGDDHVGDDNEAVKGEPPLGSKSNPGYAVKYECSTCKRCFKSHQALGGHRASHRKTKGCFALMNHNTEESMLEGKEDNSAGIDDYSNSELDQWQSVGHRLSVARHSLHNPGDESKAQAHSALFASATDQLPASSSKKKKFKGHACSICHRIFPSGQALGGHKRCHWQGEKIAESCSMVSSSNNQGFVYEQDEWAGSADTCTPSRARHCKEDRLDLNLPAPPDEDDEVGYCNARTSRMPEVVDQDEEGYGLEDTDGDGEDFHERFLVDYMGGGKKRSLNKLFSGWDAEAGIREDLASSVEAAGVEQMGGDCRAKRRSDRRAACTTGGSVWDLEWRTAALSSTAVPSISQVCAMQPP